MIESPSSTAIIEPKPPVYTDSEPDAPLSKEDDIPLPAYSASDDVEITLIDHKPITSSIRTSMTHLHRTGGFFARWRGLGLALLYSTLHSLVANTLGSLFGFSFIGQSLIYILTCLALARLHMVWTHSKIAAPSNKRWYRRVVPRKQCKAIMLPTLVLAVAQQATIILPVAVAFALGLPQSMHHGATQPEGSPAPQHRACAMQAFLALRFLAVPLTFLAVFLAVLLPAAVTLTRIEAALLPADESAIVPFDRDTVIGDLDLETRGACRAVFVQAWRSFDRAARLRLVKLYAKNFMLQTLIAVLGFMLIVSEVALIGGDRLFLFTKAKGAQMQLNLLQGAGVN